MLFLQIQKGCKVSNGLDDFKVALDVGPNGIDGAIHSDHCYLEMLEKPLCSALTQKKSKIFSDKNPINSALKWAQKYENKKT